MNKNSGFFILFFIVLFMALPHSATTSSAAAVGETLNASIAAVSDGTNVVAYEALILAGGRSFSDNGYHAIPTAQMTINTTGGTLLIIVNLSCYRGSSTHPQYPGKTRVALKVDGIENGSQVSSAFPQLAVALGLSRIIHLPAGSHTIELGAYQSVLPGGAKWDYEGTMQCLEFRKTS